MATDIGMVSRDASLAENVELMTRHPIKRNPVVDGDKVVGIVTRLDLLRSLLSGLRRICGNCLALADCVLKPCDQVAVAAVIRRIIRLLVFVEPDRAFVLVAARAAAVNRPIGNRYIVRHDFQLPVDAELLHHATHQGGPGVN